MAERRQRARTGPDVIRHQCYEEIRACMKSRILAYYGQHQELLGDERSRRAITESMEGLECIFSVLDGYAIGTKAKGAGQTPTVKS
jgi:hypothetical protein